MSKLRIFRHLAGFSAVVCAFATVVGPATVASAQPSADYTIVFESTWSMATHPDEFPPSPHFSGLIGGTHNDEVIFWESGQLASPGIKSMAETGSKTTLQAEIETAIGAGTAGILISGGGIGASPGSRAEAFTIEDSHSRVTLVSMLAPSPDWFVGVTGLELRPGGEWVDQIVVDLVVWDAGTDSGISYLSPNQPTVPPVPISEKTDGPFSKNNHVGTFTFTRNTTSVPGAAALQSPAFLLPLSANPLRDVARFELRVPSGTVGDIGIFDAAGRSIRSLLRGTLDPSTPVVWDARDNSGRAVPTGAYFIVLRAGQIGQSERIVVIH